MKKHIKSIKAFGRAFKYCFNFAWRNTKMLTIFTLVITTLYAVLSWFVIDTTGSFVSSAEYIIKNNLQSEWLYHLMPSVITLVGVLIAFSIVETLDWLLWTMFKNTMQISNTREINIFKSGLDIASFKSRAHNELLSRIETSESGFAVRSEFVEYVVVFLHYFAKALAFFVGLASYSLFYAMLLLVPIILIIFNEYSLSTKRFRFSELISLTNRKRGVMERVFTRPASFIQAKTYNQTNTLIERINIKAKIFLDGNDKFRKDFATKDIIIKIFYSVLYAGVVVAVFKNLIFGVFAAGVGVVIVMAMQQFRDAVEGTTNYLNKLFTAVRYVLVIEDEYFAIKPTLITENAVVPTFEYVPQMEIKDMHFTYPNTDREILQGVNLVIEPNSKIMIVGESGCGKTTLIQLLLRHYDTTSGDITANGVNLKNIEPKNWFNIISAQMQEYEIFERKISHEIASSRFDEPVDMEKVRWAGDIACLDTVIADTKDGYDTQIGVGFGGQDFSGGENQRIAIARTIYRDTPILLLDEPDAKLDPMNAAKLFDNVLKMKDKTVIVVSHKVSRAHLFDNIVVIKDGTIYEVGNHDDLYKRRDHYYDLLQAEKSRKEDELEVSE